MRGDHSEPVGQRRSHPHLAGTPWPAEDGGPQRQQRADRIPGPNAGGARLAAVRQAAVSVMAVLAPDDRVLVLRNTIGPDGVTWVEDVDPESLEERRRSPDLALGPFWPGGFAVLADGAVLVVQGRHAHRLTPDLEVEATQDLGVDAPHNSFVALGDGSIATKDLQMPAGGTASTLHVLDPVTLEDRADPMALPEPCVARLSADVGATSTELVVVGTTAVHRYRWDGAAGTLTPARPSATYVTHPDQSYGWDPVLAAGATWFLDNGDHTYPNGFTMLGNGVAAGPVRLWRQDDVTGELSSVEVCGRPGGAVTNPPLVDADRGLVLAYDSANGVLAAFGVDDLAKRWERELNTSMHLVLYPDTGEVLVNDHDPAAGDALAVLQIEDGSVRAHVRVESPAQSVVFGAPGTRRDAYYVSLSTLARIQFTG